MKNRNTTYCEGRCYILYEKIKELCDAKGISIHGMCVALGINDSTISNLKTRDNQRSLSAEAVAKIADFFNVPAKSFFE